MEATVTLTHTGDRKRRRGDLWLDRSDLSGDHESVPAGAVVDLQTEKGHFRGRGFYSSRGPIAVRVVSNSKQTVDRTFFESRVRRAVEFRGQLYGSRMSHRLVNGAGDLLPGLIVERFGDVLVVQLRNQTLDQRRETVVDVLDEIFQPASIYARNDVESRRREGLEAYRGLLSGQPVADQLTIQKQPYQLVTNVKSGQKTGYYLDQEQNRRRLWGLSEGRRAIDAFCYTGGWGMAALHGGAEHVTFVDRSEQALDLVEYNASLNGWSERIDTVKQDAIDFLNEVRNADRSPGLVILDPPAFTRSDRKVGSALRGYKEINLRAMQLVKPRGILATSSCSAPVSMNDFQEVITDSAHDAHVLCRMIEKRYQGPDHPWLANLPSSLYLKCILAEVTLL